VLAVLRGLQPGEVMTYGEVAHDAGFPNAARAVGNLLRMTDQDVPWWRVVRADGSLAKGARQRGRLEAEGVPFRGARVDMRVARLP